MTSTRSWLTAAVVIVMTVALLAGAAFAQGPAASSSPVVGALAGEACSEAVACAQGLRCKDGVCALPLISYPTYKTLHIIAVLLAFLALGGLIFLQRAEANERKQMKLPTLLHGVAMLFILVGGFGLMARIGINHGAAWPLWIKLKFVLWALLGAFVMLPRRISAARSFAWPALLVLGAIAAWVATHKPV